MNSIALRALWYYQYCYMRKIVVFVLYFILLKNVAIQVHVSVLKAGSQYDNSPSFRSI